MKNIYLKLFFLCCFNTALFAQNQLTSYKSTWWLQETVFNPATSAARNNSDVTVMHGRSLEVQDFPMNQSSFLSANHRFKNKAFAIGLVYNSHVQFFSANSALGLNLNYKFKLSENQDLIVGTGVQLAKEKEYDLNKLNTVELVAVGSTPVTNFGLFYRFKKIELSYCVNNIFKTQITPLSHNIFRHLGTVSFEMKLNDKLSFRPTMMYERVLIFGFLNFIGEFNFLNRYTMGLRVGDPGIIGCYASVLLMEKLKIGFYQQIGEASTQGIVEPINAQIFINYRFDKKVQ